MSYTIPYAPQERFQQPNRISDLLLRAAEVQAEGQRRSGAIWGNAISNLGGIAGDAIQARAEQKQQQAQANELSRRDAAFMALLDSSRGNPDPKEVYRIFGPDKAPKIVEGLVSFQGLSQKKGEDAAKYLPGLIRGMDTMSEQMRAGLYPSIVAQAEQSGAIPPGFAPKEYTSDNWKAIKATVLPPEKPPEGFTLGEGQVRFGPDGKQIAAVPVQAPKPEGPRVVGRSLVGPDGKLIYRDPESPDKSGQNKVWVMRPGADGKLAPLFVSEAEVKPGDQPANSRSGEGRPSNGVEKRSLNFFNRARQADEELSKLSAVIGSKGLGGQAWIALAPNFAQTNEGQAYTQAQRAFTEARLRKDSGAAIPEQEFANDRRTYFVQPGDSPETIAQKERGRAAVLASLAFESGRALNEFYGEEADGMLESFKGRQQAQEPLKNGDRVPAPKTSPRASVKPPDTVTFQGKTVPFSSLPPDIQAKVMELRGAR